MRVVLEASLSHFTAGELLALVAAHGRGGTIDAEQGDKRARLFFQSGKLAWAESPGNVPPESIVIDLAGWTSGTFRVLDAVALPDNVTPVSLDVAPLVAEGVRRAAEGQRLLAMYPSDDILFNVVQQPKPGSGEMISLRPDEFQILFQIGPGKTLAQLRAEAGRPPLELYATLHRLQSAGLLSATGALPEATVHAPVAAKPEPEPPRPTTKGVTREQRATRAEARPKTVAKMKPLIATLTTETGTMHPLLEEETTIGRDDRNTIAVPNGSVSSRHARIVRTGDGFVIEDLGSRNGTFVNSDPVTERRVLADNDIVRLGKVLLTFNIAKEARPRDTTKPEFVP
jgi:hypothetical protein